MATRHGDFHTPTWQVHSVAPFLFWYVCPLAKNPADGCFRTKCFAAWETKTAEPLPGTSREEEGLWMNLCIWISPCVCLVCLWVLGSPCFSWQLGRMILVWNASCNMTWNLWVKKSAFLVAMAQWNSCRLTGKSSGYFGRAVCQVAGKSEVSWDKR